MSNFAWVTLTTNDTYSLGALVLAHSLRRAGTAHQLAILVTPGVSESMIARLKDVYNVVQEVNIMDSQDAANLALLARPELGVTFTKLHCWRLVQFEKCVFLDSDTLVLQNCDELFEREELSAAPDVSWPDCFNSGVFVFKPSLDTFAKITELAITSGSFDGGDQGLLNTYFSDWATADIKKHLPFIYNVTAYASYCYLPAFKQFRDKIKILHFAGKMKPWLIQFNSESKTACTPSEYAHAHDLIQDWWTIFCDNVHQNLTDNMHYWPTSMQWNYYEQIHNNQEQYEQQEYHNHNQHQHHHHHQNHNEVAAQPAVHELYAFDLNNIKDYRDPWEDYYEKLEQEEKTHNIVEEKKTEEQIVYEQVCEETHVEIMAYREESAAPEDAASECEHRGEESAVEQNNCNNMMMMHQAIEEHNTKSDNNDDEQIVTQHHQENNVDDEIENDKSHNHTPHHNDNVDVDVDNVKDTSSTPTSTNQICSSNYEVIHKTENVTTTKTTTTTTRTTNENDVNLLNVKTNYHSLDSNRKNTNENSNKIVNEAGLAGALSQLRLGEQRTPEQEAYEQLMRRQCWESGQIDYSGKDSFENIWKKISQTLEQKPTSTKDDKSGSS